MQFSISYSRAGYTFLLPGLSPLVSTCKSGDTQKDTAVLLGVDLQWFRECLGDYYTNHVAKGDYTEASYETKRPAPAQPGDVPVVIRGMNESGGVEFSTFDEAVRCCDLPKDVDFHHTSPPSADRVEATIMRMTPRPDYAWRTHGGGIRGIYRGPRTLHWQRSANIARKCFRSLREACPSPSLHERRRVFHSNVNPHSAQRCFRNANNGYRNSTGKQVQHDSTVTSMRNVNNSLLCDPF